MNFTYNEGLTEEQIALKEVLVSEILKDYSKDRYSTSTITKIPVHSNLEGFIDSVKYLIDQDQINADQKIMLLDDHSKDNIFQDPEDPNRELSGLVLYSMDKRAPGTMKGGNTWFSNERREVKPRIREIVDDPKCPGQTKLILSQWFDNRICMKICARTNKRANELANWFEDIIEQNRYYFAVKGITKLFMDERDRDSQQQIGNEQVECRPFFFFVRTEKTYELKEQKLNKLVVSLITKQ